MSTQAHEFDDALPMPPEGELGDRVADLLAWLSERSPAKAMAFVEMWVDELALEMEATA